MADINYSSLQPPTTSDIATAVAAAVPTTAGITSIVQANAGGKTGKFVVLTGSGTWTPPTTPLEVWVTCVGGGGGGGAGGGAMVGGSSYNNVVGGGTGGYAGTGGSGGSGGSTVTSNVTLNGAVNYSVGGGGGRGNAGSNNYNQYTTSGAAYSNQNAGAAGGTTTFFNVSADGGAGGSAGNYSYTTYFNNVTGNVVYQEYGSTGSYKPSQISLGSGTAQVGSGGRAGVGTPAFGWSAYTIKSEPSYSNPTANSGSAPSTYGYSLYGSGGGGGNGSSPGYWQRIGTQNVNYTGYAGGNGGAGTQGIIVLFYYA